MYFEFMKLIFFSPIPASQCLLDSFLTEYFLIADSGEQSHYGLDSYFLDMMYFEFMKNFLLAYSGEQMPVRLITASWSQKGFVPTF